MTQVKQPRGFTLIELMLAMTFLATILLIATLVIVQMLSIYNKGIATKQINQVGRSLNEDMSRVANGGSVAGLKSGKSFLCIGSTAYFWNVVGATKNFVYSDNRANVGIARSTSGDITRYCQNPDDFGSDIAVPRSDATELISDQVRIYDANVTSDGQGALVRIKLAMGSYFPASADNPQLNPVGNLECGTDKIGNYCAVGNFETTVYVPNR